MSISDPLFMWSGTHWISVQNIVILGPDDPIPPDTPVNTIICRREW